jgi:hypothetical protein
MRPVNERMVLIFILTIISVAALLCLIGLATPGWDGHNVFTVATLSGILTIISVLLLLVCFIMVGIILSGAIIHQHLPFIFVSILIISSVIMLGGFSSYFYSFSNYSYSLMVAAFTFTYLSSIIATYWLFGVRDSHRMTVISGKHSQPKLDVLT